MIVGRFTTMQASDIKQELSISYLMAVCAQAGIDYDTIRHDADSTDALLKKQLTLIDGTSYIAELRVQLKSTSSSSMYKCNDTSIIYSLKIKNYNDLCRRATSPIILCLLILPESETEWVKWSEQELLLKGCMYWKAFPNESPSDNTSSINISIPKNHVVNAETLKNMLSKIAMEEWP